MKNSIPLVLAVLLGLAAVFAVSRVISSNIPNQEEMVKVVAAQRDIKKGETIAEGYFRPKDVPKSAVPSQAILWSRSAMIAGQKSLRNIASGDYILLGDVGLNQSVGNVVGEGEWAVAIQLPSKSIVSMLRPGDEVAIIGTFNLEMKPKGGDQAAQPSSTKKEVTMVLFPRVRVLDVGSGVNGDNTGTLVLLLPPQQAQALIAAQRVADLYPALRRPNDDSALNRLDAGMVDGKTFSSLLDGLDTVIIPKAPNINK